MKIKFIPNPLFLICFSFLVLFVSCLEKKLSQNTRIKIINKTIDLGLLSKSDSLVEVSHIIKNIGEHDLFLSELKTSCGCTGVNIDKNAIKPGDSTFVRLDIDLKDKYGPLGIYTKFVANTKEGYHSLFIKMIIK